MGTWGYATPAHTDELWGITILPETAETDLEGMSAQIHSWLDPAE